MARAVVDTTRVGLRRILILLAVSIVVLVLAAVGYQWWKYYRWHVSTDDAYVAANVALITPRVAGTVVELPVSDNWQVEAGTLLARLDPSDYELKLRDAEAALAQAKQSIAELRAEVHAADSDVELAEAELTLAQRDNERVAKLYRERVVSDDEVDRRQTALRVARARVAAARQQAVRARAALGIAIDAPDADAPAVRRAVVARDMAARQLSYTELRSPLAGVIDARTVQLGQHVDPGQALMRVVPLQDAYVEANFKETQITDVHVGQPVSVIADAYPDVEYRGVVDGLAPGTGASSALLPPENATGNWIKVVQRVPVKIRLTTTPSAPPLRVGLSVVATIDVHDTSGSLLMPLSQTAQR